MRTRSCRCAQLSVVRYRLTRNGFMARNVSGAFEKRAPAGIICGTIWGSFAGRDHLRGCTVPLLLISSLLLVDGTVGMPRPTRYDGINWKGFSISQAFKFNILYSLPAFDSYGISFYSVFTRRYQILKSKTKKPLKVLSLAHQT